MDQAAQLISLAFDALDDDAFERGEAPWDKPPRFTADELLVALRKAGGEDGVALADAIVAHSSQGPRD